MRGVGCKKWLSRHRRTRAHPGPAQVKSDSGCKASVLMLAYNHEPFIEQAINSVLAQETAFAFELLIGEDCSRDRTRTLADGFAKRFPGTVKVVSSDRNVGLGENFRRLVRAASGQYLAFCEGDDYWNGSSRLAQQVQALEASPSSSFVYGDFDRTACIDGVWRVFPSSTRTANQQLRQGRIFEDLLDRIDIHLSTMICRADLAKSYIEGPLFDPALWLCDVPLILYLAAHGEVGAMDARVSTYRHHASSITQSSMKSRLKVVRDHVAVVRSFEVAFQSHLARRQKRLAQLNSMIASAAYSARDIAVYREHSARSWKSTARLLMMHVPALHAIYLRHVIRKQQRHFFENSVSS